MTDSLKDRTTMLLDDARNVDDGLPPATTLRAALDTYEALDNREEFHDYVTGGDEP